MGEALKIGDDTTWRKLTDSGASEGDDFAKRVSIYAKELRPPKGGWLDLVEWKKEVERIRELLNNEKRGEVVNGLVSALENEALCVGPKRIGALVGRLLEITSKYTELSKRLSSMAQPRDLSKMLAWTRQARSAVCPKYGDAIENKDKLHDGFFHLFVEIAVILVVVMEDIGETIQGEDLKNLRATMDEYIWLRTCFPNGMINLKALKNFEELPELHQNYMCLLRDCFDLFEDVEETLTDEAPDDDPALEEHLDEIRKKKEASMQEVFEMIGFSRDFDHLIKTGEPIRGYKLLNTGKEAEVTLENLPEREDYLRQNQSNICMTYMLLASFSQQWAWMTPEQRSQYDFEELLAEMNELGLAIEYLGSLANDIATFFRELGENFVANSIMAEGLRKKVITALDLEAVFNQVKEMGPRDSEALLSNLSRAIFSNRYEDLRDIFGEEWPRNPICKLVDSVYNNELFSDAVLHWREKFIQIKTRFESSPLAKFIDLSDFLRKQENFLKQYVSANGLV